MLDVFNCLYVHKRKMFTKIGYVQGSIILLHRKDEIKPTYVFAYPYTLCNISRPVSHISCTLPGLLWDKIKAN